MGSMETPITSSAFWRLLVSQAQVAFNDHAVKIALIGLVQMTLLPVEAMQTMSWICLLLVLPFVLLAPLAGWCSDRFGKRDVILASLLLQLAVMGLIIRSLWSGDLTWVLAGFFILAAQSTFLAPAKRGLLGELFPVGQLSRAVGWCEVAVIFAILAGSFLGGWAFDALSAWSQSPWQGALLVTAILAGLCFLAIWLFQSVPRRSGNPELAFHRRHLFGHWAMTIDLWRVPFARWAALGESAFYFVGGVLMIVIAQVARLLHPTGEGIAGWSGLALAVLGAGVALGSLCATLATREGSRLVMIPAAAGGITVSLLLLAALVGQVWFLPGLAVLGFFGGLFLVPLGAVLIASIPEEKRGRFLAATSLWSSLAGIFAVGWQWVTGQYFTVSVAGQLILLACFMACVAVLAAKQLLREIITWAGTRLGGLRYQVDGLYGERLPDSGGVLLVANHVSYVDTIVLALASPRPIQFLSYEGFFRYPLLGTLLKAYGAIPVSTDRSKEAIRLAAARVESGEVVCIFPEGQLTRTGNLMELKRGYELIARQAKCPIVPVFLDGLWGSIFSFAQGRYFWKWPKGWRRRVRVIFGDPMEPTEATPERLRQVFSELGQEAFALRPELEETLSRALLRRLRRRPWQCGVVDHHAGRHSLTNWQILVAACCLAEKWRHQIHEQHVGVLLPPGRAGILANVALLLAGKVPVNLNPTCGTAAAQHCLEASSIRVVITARPLRAKFPQFPWPATTMELERLLPTLSRWRKLRWVLAVSFLPQRWLERLISRRTTSGEAPAFLLFTSGSTGHPKGVALSSRNILANIAQVTECGLLKDDDTLLTCLPLFHSFGLTMGVLFPLLSGRTVVSVSSPFDWEHIAAAALQEKPSCLLGTPTFLRNYLRKIPGTAFASLRFVLSGAEKLPASLGEEFFEHFGVPILEGYGLTEASPVVAFNQLDPALGLAASTVQSGGKFGSVGRIVNGLAYQLLDPQTLLPEKKARRGLLAIKGANVIAHYLNGALPDDRFQKGWFLTGDIVEIDADGFLQVQGRLSRFSKIGGEMVPHGAIEEALACALGGESGIDVVLGQPDADGQEELVLLTTRQVRREEVRVALTAQGLPNLWVPRRIYSVAELPFLASGKLDLAACRQILDNARQLEPEASVRSYHLLAV